MTRSVSTSGPLDKEDTGGQKLIPTGSLPTTLQGATVCILVFLKIWTLIIYMILFTLSETALLALSFLNFHPRVCLLILGGAGRERETSV